MSATDFFGVLASAMGVAMALAPLFQVRRVLERGQADDVSLAFLAVIAAGSSSWCAYGISTGDPYLIIPNSLGVITERRHAARGAALLGRMDDLEECLRAAWRRDPNDPAPHFGLANVFLDTGRDGAARESFRRAVALDPKFRRRHAALGSRLAARDRYQRAARMYHWGLDLNPSDPELRHMLLAIDGSPKPARASDAYVAAYFDAFADSFDEVLLGSLDYHAPQVIVEALRQRLPTAPQAELSVLDAGCGTGLCGPLLRPYARRLVGIDLSPRMLEVAEASRTYDELHITEVVGAMVAEREGYDLIVAADVLVYFGPLDELFRAVAGALRPGGLAGVTVERHDGDGYTLRPSGRYAHTAEYLRAAAAQAGLDGARSTGMHVPTGGRETRRRLCGGPASPAGTNLVRGAERPLVPLPRRSQAAVQVPFRFPAELRADRGRVEVLAVDLAVGHAGCPGCRARRRGPRSRSGASPPRAPRAARPEPAFQARPRSAGSSSESATAR